MHKNLDCPILFQIMVLLPEAIVFLYNFGTEKFLA